MAHEIYRTYNSIGARKEGAVGISSRGDFLSLEGVYSFNEAYHTSETPVLGWSKNERGYYVGLGKESDVIKVSPVDGYQTDADIDIYDGVRGTPAFTPKYILDEEYGTPKTFGCAVNTSGVLAGDVLSLKAIVGVPSVAQAYNQDGEYSRAIFSVLDPYLNSVCQLIVYAKGNMGIVEASALGTALNNRTGFFFLDGRFHLFELVLRRDGAPSVYIDGNLSWSRVISNTYSGKVESPEIGIYYTTSTSPYFMIQSVSLEHYNEI